jgi:putative SOS response-associated peptidase YedK
MRGTDASIDQVSRAELLMPLLRPYPSEEMSAYAGSPFVNSPSNEGPRRVEPSGEVPG